MERGDASDAILVDRARAGDRSALAALVERHRPTAMALCLALLHRPDVADDAVQEALLIALVGLDRLRRPDRFGPWLCGISLNVARRWLRDAGRRMSDPQVSAVPDQRPGPEQSAIASETTARVRLAVAALPPGQRDAVALYYLGERSGAEVAEALSISQAATKTRLHKGRRALRHALADQAEVRMATTIDMRVVEVRREPPTAEPVRRHAIVLEDGNGEHRLPIYVGEPEATAIALHLAEVDLPRPFTHMLLSNVIGALGGRVVEVRVTRLAEGTFFGEIALDGPAGPTAVDARPSDAVNLALLNEVPIRVEADVLAEVQAGRHRELDQSLTEGTDQIAAEFQDALRTVLAGLEDEPDEPS